MNLLRNPFYRRMRIKSKGKNKKIKNCDVWVPISGITKVSLLLDRY